MNELIVSLYPWKLKQAEIVLKFVPSKDNVALVLTKSLGGQRHNSLDSILMIDM